MGERPWLRGRLRTANGCGNCVDGCGRRGCNGVAGNGWGEEAAGDERPWLRGRLRTANGCGELRERLPTAWVQRSGWKWVGRRSHWWWATLAARTAADGKWVRRTAWTAADGVGATEWLEMGGEKKPLVMSDLGCADGCGRQMGAENCADGCGRRGCKVVARNRQGEEAAGDERPWLRGRQMGAENCADGCGRRGCKMVAGNRWGEEAAGDERPWLRGRLRTANGCGELRGRLRTAWVQRSGWKWVGRRSHWWWATLAARTAADGKWVRRIARTAADGVGATEWLEIGGEKKPLVMSDLSCADGCGWQMGAENCADGCGQGGCNRVAGNGWGEGKWKERMGKEGTERERKGQEGKGRERMGKEGKRKKPLVMSDLGCAEGCGRQMGAEICADGGGRRGWATLAARTAADGKWVRRTAWTAADGVGATEWLEMGGEKKPLVMSDLEDLLGCAEGCGRQMGAERLLLPTHFQPPPCTHAVRIRPRSSPHPFAAAAVRAAKVAHHQRLLGDERPWLRGRLRTANGCGELRGRLRTAGNGWGEEAAGDERPWLRGRLRTANGCGELRGRLRTAWVQGGGWKWVGRRSMVMSDLGCADGCGQQMGAENCVDGCGRRGCNGVAGNWWGEEAAGDERPWLRGRLRTANGCGELRGRLRTAWVQGRSWKWVGRWSRWWWARLAARTAADGKWVRRVVMRVLGCRDGCGRAMGAEKCADGCGQRGCNGVAGKGWGMVGRRSRWWWATLAARTATDGKWVGRMAWTAADGVGTREWLEMGGEKKPLVMSDLGCADGCGREMGAENCADGCGRRGCNGVAGNSWGKKKPLGMSKLGCADGCGRAMAAENSTDDCGQRGCNWKGGNGWGEAAAGDERPWLCGRLRTGNGCGEVHGRLRTAWVQGSGWKWVGRRSRWWWASLAARTAADGVGSRLWLEMGGEKKPLEISELDRADGCGREMDAENCADGSRRRGCNGVAGNGWGEEAAGDVRA